MTEVASRNTTLNLFGGSLKDQLFRLQANELSSTLQTAHPLVLGCEKLTIQNADGSSIDNVVNKFQEVDTAIVTETFTARTAESTLTDNLSAEVTRANDAESALQMSLTAEVNRAGTAEDQLQSNIDSEESRAMGIENFLRNDVDDARSRVGTLETRNFVPYGSLEIQGQSVAKQDGNNCDQLVVKSQYHTDVECTKSFASSEMNTKTVRYSQIPVVNNLYSLGTSAKTWMSAFVNSIKIGGDITPTVTDTVTLGSMGYKFSDIFSSNAHFSSCEIDGKSVALADDLQQETIDRLAADAEEKTAREAAITAEQVARDVAISLAQANLTTSINNETAMRTAEDNAIRGEIGVEKARIDMILQGTSIDLDELQELIQAYTQSDASLLQQINTLTASMTQAQNDIVANKALQDTLSSEVSTLTSTADFPLPPQVYSTWTYVNSNSFTKLPAPYITHEAHMTVTVPTVYFSIANGTVYISFNNETTVYRGSETQLQEGNWPQLLAQTS